MISMYASDESPTPCLNIWRGEESKPFSSNEYKVAGFDRAVLSWNCKGSASFELEVNGERYLMGNWSDKPESKKTDAVDVDTLVLKKPATSFKFHVKPGADSTVTLVAVTHWMNSDHGTYSDRRSQAWGKILDVPPRSQGIEQKDPGSICSPTSLSMALEFHGFKKTTREVADGVYDHGEKIYGNWPFNTAYAHRLSGLESYVVHAGGLEEIESEIAAGRPAVTGMRWDKGDLTDSSINSTNGHLICVVGFNADGDVVVNDPAAKPGGVRRVYKRREFFKCWLEKASGIIYVVKPKASSRARS
jgi:hypothetical protein